MKKLLFIFLLALLSISVISCDNFTTTTTISGPVEYVHHVQYLMSIDNYALETDGYRIYVDNTTDIIYVGNILLCRCSFDH